MKLMNLSISTMVFRFYLMMAIIVAAGFSGLWFLSILALPVFFSCLMGIQFKKQHSIRKPQMSKNFNVNSEHQHPAHE